MPSGVQYRELAQQCRRCAREVKTEEQRQMLHDIEMISQVLAEEEERKAAGQ